MERVLGRTVIQFIPTGRISECVDIPSAQIQETVEGVKCAGQEFVQNRTLEQLVDVTVPRDFNVVDERTALEALF